MIGVAMTDQEVKQVDFPQGVIFISMVLTRRDPVVDFCGEVLNRTPVGRMIIAINNRRIVAIQNHLKQFLHINLD